MKKWLYLLFGLVLFVVISKMNRKRSVRSPFFKRMNETFSILVWVLLAVYTLTFLDWLFKQIFHKSFLKLF